MPPYGAEKKKSASRFTKEKKRRYRLHKLAKPYTHLYPAKRQMLVDDLELKEVPEKNKKAILCLVGDYGYSLSLVLPEKLITE